MNIFDDVICQELGALPVATISSPMSMFIIEQLLKFLLTVRESKYFAIFSKLMFL